MSGPTLEEQARATIGDDLSGSVLISRADLACLLQLIRSMAVGHVIVLQPHGLVETLTAALKEQEK